MQQQQRDAAIACSLSFAAATQLLSADRCVCMPADVHCCVLVCVRESERECISSVDMSYMALRCTTTRTAIRTATRTATRVYLIGGYVIYQINLSLCTCICIHAYTLTHKHVCVCVSASVCVCVCVCVYACACIHVRVNVRVHVRVQVRMPVHVVCV